MGTRTRITEVAVTTPPFFLNGNGVANTRPAIKRLNLNQTTVSEGHPYHWLHKKKVAGRRDIGGPFHTRKYIWSPQYKDKRFTADRYVTGVKYVDGNLHILPADAAIFNNLFSESPESSDATMDAWGTTAIAGVIPTKSEVDVVVSTVELAREGLPKMIGQGLLKSQLKDFRKAGDEILNIEFGIKPLISDIKGVSKSIVEAAERIKQLERDSGRLVRRKFDFPIREESIRTIENGFRPVGWEDPYLYSDSAGNFRQNQYTFQTKRWFSGAFTYHLNIGERQRSQLYAAADNARLLLGVKLDAETLWNLTPWSWLADWFGNAGDIATNVSHFSRDGLVMPYGYMMVQTSSTRMSTAKLNWKDSAMPSSVRDSASFVRKQRRAAHPFGFGLTDAMLDQRQLTILGALGVTRIPGK